MSRVVVTVAVLAALPLGVRAGEPAVRLTVRPMAAPQPALRYQLLPDVAEQNPGNPAQWYVRCFQEQRNFFYNKGAVEERARYRTMPLAELPADKLVNYGGSALSQADWGARLDSLDWQVTQRVQTEGLDVALLEIGPLRLLPPAQQVRFRAEVAGRHFDDAVRTAKSMFALARHLGEYPAVAANQVGLDAAGLALDTLQEMVQQPGCPNLYWALADLPVPLVDLRKGLQAHRAQVATELKRLRDDVAMTDADMEAVVSRLSGMIGYAREQAGQAPRNLRGELRARAADKERVGTARRRLVENGCGVIVAATFSPAQVILLDEKRTLAARQDDGLKLLALPASRLDAPACDGGLFADLLPDAIALRRAQARLEQRIAVLRHVEALRMYAAEHGGKLPEKLADVPVPLPADSFTGQPFAYRAEGSTAHLAGGRYDVTIQTDATKVAGTFRVPF